VEKNVLKVLHPPDLTAPQWRTVMFLGSINKVLTKYSDMNHLLHENCQLQTGGDSPVNSPKVPKYQDSKGNNAMQAVRLQLGSIVEKKGGEGSLPQSVQLSIGERWLLELIVEVVGLLP
jgi:hypothetical protein